MQTQRSIIARCYELARHYVAAVWSCSTDRALDSIRSVTMGCVWCVVDATARVRAKPDPKTGAVSPLSEVLAGLTEAGKGLALGGATSADSTAAPVASAGADAKAVPAKADPKTDSKAGAAGPKKPVKPKAILNKPLWASHDSYDTNSLATISARMLLYNPGTCACALLHSTAYD